MASRTLKSNMLHPYQKSMVPFWRFNNLPPTMGYSESVKEQFELAKLDFDAKAKYINWTQK